MLVKRYRPDQRSKRTDPGDRPTRRDPERETAVFIDCREPNEFNLGHIPGAILIPRGQLEQNIEALVQRDRRIILYCASGNRSALGADTLQQMGYTDVVSLAAGFRGWFEGGGEVDG
jgi:rhodanese-related sulfurtransferase